MPGGHSTLNTVVLGEGVSKSKYTPYFGHHSSPGMHLTFKAGELSEHIDIVEADIAIVHRKVEYFLT